MKQLSYKLSEMEKLAKEVAELSKTVPFFITHIKNFYYICRVKKIRR